MSEPLSYLSTLEEVISASEAELRQGFGYLAPDTVMEYVMYLRHQLKTAQKNQEMSDTELARLTGLISQKDASLAEFMGTLAVGNVPAVAPFDVSISPPPPGCLPAVLYLPYTGCSEKLDNPSSFEQPLSASLSPDSPMINQVHNVKLQQGFVIEASFVYKNGTQKFNINLLKGNQNFNIFHLDFRPHPHGNVLVMNTNPAKNWEKEIRAGLPPLKDGELSHVTIECGGGGFRVKINDSYIEKNFPYRYPLDDVAMIKLNHGSLGNKWVALSWKHTKNVSNVDSLASLPPIIPNIELGDNVFRPGTQILGKALFKEGTSKFTINFLKQTGFNIFHLDFRPQAHPHGSVIVMNSNPNKSWETEVRARLPHLTDGQLMLVRVECGDKEFKVQVNDSYIEKTFPYRYPLEDVTKVSVVHGSHGNKWTSIVWC